MPGADSLKNRTQRTWDPIVRLTHWGVAAGVILNRLVIEGGSGLHLWLGLAVAALLGLRLVWGIVGPAEARFTAFPPSPGRALKHIGDIRAGRRVVHASHNPLGALMVYALWATLAVVIGSGVAMSGFPPTVRAEGEAVRPAAAIVLSTGPGKDDGDAATATPDVAEDGGVEGEGAAEEIHEAAANLLLALAFLHIAGVAFETRRSGRQVLAAMLGG